jgi:hypothetical protein
MSGSAFREAVLEAAAPPVWGLRRMTGGVRAISHIKADAGQS